MSAIGVTFFACYAKNLLYILTEPMNYWLMKSEPDAYSIDDLARDTTEPWTGVRGYQARNYMRDSMQIGDEVLYYHSNANPPGVVGLAKITSAPYPDPSAFDVKSEYYDPKSNPAQPTWILVDITFVKKFDRIMSLEEMRNDPKLEGMLVTRRGSRLSIQPVSAEHFKYIKNTLEK